ncbi:MAG: fluoride efflux transporter CrcB [Gordonia sp. (in: high G+C Gram-positive bacteria)]|uniref:fluoride efflux transporter CrcB n=1 Tax=Gordonia sp. (in: high G+C Gram-positive bacteria) TaxID=84139 RepID=UPI003BB58CF0
MSVPGTSSRGFGALAGQSPLLALVFVGGMLGAPARYGVEHVLPAAAGGFPLGTFAVNVVGAFLLGLLLESLILSGPDTGVRNRLRLFLGTGFLGAFTTYSSFAVQLDRLGRGGHASTAVGYAAVSLAVGLALVALGIWVAQRARQYRGAGA